MHAHQTRYVCTYKSCVKYIWCEWNINASKFDVRNVSHTILPLPRSSAIKSADEHAHCELEFEELSCPTLDDFP